MVWKGGISIPDVASLEAGISLDSVSYDITNGNEYKQGASLDFSLGAGPMTIYNSSFSYERSSSGSCVLDLIGKDFETDYESSNSATITLPIPGFAITIDIEQVIDLTEKIWDSIWN